MKEVTISPTKEIVNKLKQILKAGLQMGAGSMTKPGTFCVQQAVSKAIGHPDFRDQPHICVGSSVNEFGITVNDQNWSSDEARAKGMERFAIAELGSNKINQNRFEDKLLKKFEAKYPDRGAYSAQSIPEECYDDKELAEACEMAVQVLIEMGCEGTKYLDLKVNEKEKKQIKKLVEKIDRLEVKQLKQLKHYQLPPQFSCGVQHIGE